MPKDNNIVWILVLVAFFIYIYNQPSQTSQPPAQDLTNLLDAGVIFSGQDMFSSGVSLSNEHVRVIKQNGELKDLGTFSLNSGTVSTVPNDVYKFYYFLNSSAVYPYIIEYTAPMQEASVNKAGYGCTIDVKPTFSSTNSNGVGNSPSNPQSLSASQSVDINLRIVAHSDECYGMPGIEGIHNAICFAYSSTAYSSVKTSSGFISAPSTVSNNVSGFVKCYNMDLIKDMEELNIPLSLTATAVEPTTAHNITVYAEDVSADLSATDLSEIFGYVDEDGNNLGANVVELGKIYIS